MLRIKPTILIGLGRIGCHTVELYLNKVKEKSPESLHIVRALGIDIYPKEEELPFINFHVENLAGFIPSKIAEGMILIKQDEPLYWFKSNITPDRISKMGEMVQSDPMIRPIGRLSLFLKINKIHKILKKYIHEIRLIWKERPEQVNIFVISPIFDGFGSGSILDMVYISRSASAIEKVKSSVIGILISKDIGNMSIASLQHGLEVANSYACLREVSHFQETSSYEAPPIDLVLDLRDKMFNSCYLFNQGKVTKNNETATSSMLASTIGILSMTPQNSTKRLILDQMEKDEPNFASFGIGILSYNSEYLVSFCVRKLCYDLLTAVLNGQIEKQVREQPLSLNIEEYNCTKIQSDFKKRIDENELRELSTIKWSKIKNINDNEELKELRRSLFNEKIVQIHQLMNNHFLEMKNNLFADIESDYNAILNIRTDGMIYFEKSLSEISSAIKRFSDEASRTNKDLASKQDEIEKKSNQLLAEIEKVNKASCFQKIKETFNREWVKRQKKIIEEFSSLFLMYIRQRIDNSCWEAIINFYLEIDGFLKKLDERVNKIKISLNKLLENLIDGDEEKGGKIYDYNPSSQFLLKKEDLERIYEKFKPETEQIVVDFYNHSHDLYALNNETIHQFQDQLMSICSHYFENLPFADISNILKTEDLIKFEDSLNRLYDFAEPKFGRDVLGKEGFSERVIIQSDIDENLFMNVKEKIDFDFEVIGNGSKEDIVMLREWYGIKLSTVGEMKKMEQEYLDLKMEDFPLHIFKEGYELPFISYPPGVLQNKKKLFLLGQVMRLIKKKEDHYFWVDSTGNITELAQGKENAFLMFIKKDQTAGDIEQRVNQTILDNGKEKLKIMLKNFMKKPEILNELTKRELAVLGEYYRNLNLR